MGEETTYLLAISNDTKDPKNFQPITFLSKTYKLLISFVTDRTYSHLKQNDFFLPEQKGSRRGSYVCKFMINKNKLENCKKWKQNLSYSWID